MKIGIKYLSGPRLARAALAGAHRVIASADQLDRINVFPVADSDTGKNLAATMWAVLHALEERSRDVGEVAAAMAEAALHGARGNSGVIMAQFLQGFSEGLAGKKRADLADFASALTLAKKRAWEALASPREGTILSAISAFADRVAELADSTRDFVPAMQEGLEAVQEAVAKSPELLPALKTAGVVDSGALGFARFLDGIVHYVMTGEVDEIDRTGPTPKEKKARVKYDPESIHFRYCTECTVKGKDLPVEEIKAALEKIGDSVIAAGSPRLLHLHVHTNIPARAFEIARAYGEVAGEKADDMWAQHAEAYGPREAAGLALVTDTSCDLPEDLMTRHHIQIVPLRVMLDGSEFKDRVELTPQEFYRRMREAKNASTSQPPIADFITVFDRLGASFEHVLAITIASTLSGTWNSARKAAEEVGKKGKTVQVIDSGSLSAGLGLIVLAAARGAEAGLAPDAVATLAREASERVEFWAGLPDLVPLARSGRVPWAAGWLTGKLRLGMIVKVGGGKISPVAPAWRQRQLLSRLTSLATRAMGEMKRPFIVLPHADAIGAAEALAGRLAGAYRSPDLEIHIVDASLVLGVHVGLGAFGVAVMDMGWLEERIRELGRG